MKREMSVYNSARRITVNGEKMDLWEVSKEGNCYWTALFSNSQDAKDYADIYNSKMLVPIKQAMKALAAVLKNIYVCEHESTHRGGAIWTICDQCGKRWADDEGGFKPDPASKVLDQVSDALSELNKLYPIK